MINKISIVLLISLYLILCQESNKTKEAKEQKVNPESMKNKNSTKRRPQGSTIPDNISTNEMDTILLCTLVVQQSVQKQKKDIEKVQKRLNLTNSNLVYDKVGTDIFEKCTKEVNITLVNKYFKNLTFIKDFKWEKVYDDYTKIDFDKYNNESDLRLTMSQQILMYKFHKVDEIFRQRRADDREKYENENKKIRIGKYDMDNIPTSIKLAIFLVIVIIFFGGIFYLLKTLQKKPMEKKKKEKKKKTQ